jgi:hypothetical protein
MHPHRLRRVNDAVWCAVEHRHRLTQQKKQ